MDAGNLALYEPMRVLSNKNKTSPVRTVYYGRVSTQHEAQVNAFDNQIDFYSDILRRNKNWEFVGCYYDKGVTGTNALKRPGFLKMIKEAYEGKFDLIITREVSRFARNTVDSLSYTRKLKAIGVEVYFINDNIWSFDADAELRLTIMSALSQEESAKTSTRVLAGQHTSRQNGVLYGNGNILGYSYIKAVKSIDNTYEIIEDEAETVRMIYHMYVNKKMGARAIATELHRLGRKNASGIVKWSADRVLRCIKNRTYAGYVAYNKSYTVDFIEHKRREIKDIDKHVYVKGNFEPIISDELYSKAQVIRTKKRRRLDDNRAIGKTMSQDKWGSKLVCCCGQSFKRFKWRTNKNGETYWGYTCYNIVNHKSRTFREEHNLDAQGYCDIKSICAWKLDLMIKSILQRLWDNPKDTINVLVEELADNYTEDNTIVDVDKARLLREKSRINTRLETLLDMRLDGGIDNEAFNLKHKQLKDRLEQIEEELKSSGTKVIVEKTEDVSSTISKVTEVLEEICDLSQKEVANELVDSIIRRITPTEEGIYKWYFKGEKDDEETVFSEENYLLYDAFVIDFDTARAFRKSHGNYLRNNQYEDLRVEVYVRK